MNEDFIFFLKVPLDVSLERLMNERKQVKEIYEDKEKIEKVIVGYDVLFERFKDEVVTIDGTKSIEEVTEEMVSKINLISN